MSETARFDRARDRVVRTQNCSGCGACTLLDRSLSMVLDDDGFSRPRRIGPAATKAHAAKIFRTVCPGRSVESPRSPGVTVHPMLGPVISSWEAWAGDAEIRHRGSSGGALTALASWLVETGEAPTITAVRGDPATPRRTVPVSITTRDEALAAAGSRYAPVGTLAHSRALDHDQVLIAKPCEISAARQLLAQAPGSGVGPLLLSFFCAGTPSQHATDTVLAELGVSIGEALRDLWYRGRGWPGRFTVTSADGQQASMSYDDSWGQHLGRATQWRCKICPDGVGESSDISAADFWRTDDRGYPDFTEGAGCSALLARTSRGHDLLIRAFQAGVLVGRPLNPDALAAVQPLQVVRRQTLLGRLTGTLLAGRGIPRYHGFGLTRLALRHARENLRTARGSYRRVRLATRRD